MIKYSTGQRYAAQNARVKRVCVFDTRMKYAHKAKRISMYELAHCRPIVVISLLVLIAFYCINVYGHGYSAEHRLANPAPCLFQFTGKHVEISSGVFLIKKKKQQFARAIFMSGA